MNLHSSFPIAIIGDDFESKNAVMPGERITRETQSILKYLLYARAFDRKFPGFETDIHGLRYAPGEGERRRLVDCISEDDIR
jgi:arginine decarboxylase